MKCFACRLFRETFVSTGDRPQALDQMGQVFMLRHCRICPECLAYARDNAAPMTQEQAVIEHDLNTAILANPFATALAMWA